MSTAIRRHVNMALGNYKVEGEEMLVENALTGVTGISLAFLHNKLKSGLDIGKVPADIVGGLVLSAGSSFVPGDRTVREAVRFVGATSFGVGVFRKADEYFKKSGSSTHGEVEDGIDATGMGEDDDLLKAAAKL